MLQPRFFAPWWGFSPVILLLVACASSKPEMTPAERVDVLVRHGQFALAVEEAARLRQEDPVSAEYELLHKQASMAYLLEQARRATFADNDEYAIRRFEEVLALDPNSRIAQRWLIKTRTKLADRLTNEGMELASGNQFQDAWNRYNQAVQVLPDYPRAVEAMGELDRKMAHREDMGAAYYDQGVAALVEEEYAIAANRFGYVRKYRAEDERLTRRSGQVDVARSAEHSDLGALLETERLFYAAQAEFLAALRFSPDNEKARDGVRRCELETDVALLMARGQSALTRGEFVKARALLEEAQGLTQVQTKEVQDLLDAVEQGRLTAVYAGAVHLENDLRIEQAIQAFEELLVQAPDFRDAPARLEALKARWKQAETLYGQLEGESNSGNRLSILLKIEALCPDFRDVPERIDDMERRGIKPNAPSTEATVQ